MSAVAGGVPDPFADGARQHSGRWVLALLLDATLIVAVMGLSALFAFPLPFDMLAAEEPVGVAAVANGLVALASGVVAVVALVIAMLILNVSCGVTFGKALVSGRRAPDAPRAPETPPTEPMTAVALPAAVLPAGPRQAAPGPAAPLPVASLPAASLPTSSVVMLLEGGQRIEVRGDALLGRRPEPALGEGPCQLVALEDTGRTVSKTHAAIGMDAGGAWVVDRGSRNGTGVRSLEGGLASAVGRRVYVCAGDVILMGRRVVSVEAVRLSSAP